MESKKNKVIIGNILGSISIFHIVINVIMVLFEYYSVSSYSNDILDGIRFFIIFFLCIIIGIISTITSLVSIIVSRTPVTIISVILNIAQITAAVLFYNNVLR